MAITFHPNGDVTGSSSANFGAAGTILQTKVTQYDNANGAIYASGDTVTTVSQLSLSITPASANSKFFLTLTGVNGHCNMGGSVGNHGCRYYFYQSVNGGSYVNVDGTGNYSNPICSTHINGDIGTWSDYPVNYSYIATPTYTLGQTIIFRPAFAKDISMGNSFNYYFTHNTNGIIISFIVQEIKQ